MTYPNLGGEVIDSLRCMVYIIDKQKKAEKPKLSRRELFCFAMSYNTLYSSTIIAKWLSKTRKEINCNILTPYVFKVNKSTHLYS